VPFITGCFEHATIIMNSQSYSSKYPVWNLLSYSCSTPCLNEKHATFIVWIILWNIGQFW